MPEGRQASRTRLSGSPWAPGGKQPTEPTARGGAVRRVQVQGEASLEAQSRGRITIYCIAETLNRDLLSLKLRARGPNFQLHVRTSE